MRVLVGCEESQEITKAFRELGHEAYSCDIQPCSGGHPEWHIEGDIFDVLMFGYDWPLSGEGPAFALDHDRGEVPFWDLIILHPPCTYLAVSGNRWYGKGMPGHDKRINAQKWTQALWSLAKSRANYAALENPVGVLDLGVKPQYVQPWQFGHGEVKRTGFWLYNLPPLQPTHIVEGREERIWRMGPSEDRGKLRSKTYPGIARAIAKQWGDYIRRF